MVKLVFLFLFVLAGCSKERFSFRVFTSPPAMVAMATPDPIIAETNSEVHIGLGYDSSLGQADSCAVSNPTNLSVTTPCGCTDGECVVGVTGEPDYEGEASFDYTVTGENGETSNTATQAVNVTAPNVPPVASSGSSSAQEDTEATITLAYSDAESDEADSCAISNLSNLTVTTDCACSAGVCTVGVTGDEDFSGAASFDFTVTAGGKTSDLATHIVNISAVDDAPVATSGTPTSAQEDTAVTITLSYSDVDSLADSCTISNPSNLSVTTSCACSSGVCTVGVTGDENFFGTASFDFTVTANGQTSNTVTHTVNIAGVDDAPVASGGSTNAQEDTAISISLAYTDAEGDQATSCTISNPSNLSVTTACVCSTGVCSVGVTGDENFFGTASFDYTVTANGQTSSSATHTVTIAAVDDAPVAQDITPLDLAKDVENMITLVYTDAEGDEATSCSVSNLSDLTVTEACACTSGVCSVGVTGTSGYEGAVSFTYTVTANGKTSNEATASFNLANLGSPFISKWEVSAGEKIILPLRSGYNYNFTVNWGDGTAVQTITAWNHPAKEHIYVDAGTYTVTISGTVEAWYFNNSNYPNPRRIVGVVNLGNVGWKNLEGAFYGCIDLKEFNAGDTDTSQVTNMRQMLKNAGDHTMKNSDFNISSMDTSSVTNMREMFSEFRGGPLDLDLSNFDTSKVEDMSSMFLWSDYLSINFSGFDTSNVTNMSQMFQSVSVPSLNLSSFDTSSVTNMSGMFADYYGGSITVDPVKFDTSNVTDMSGMFAAGGAPFDFSVLNTSSVTNMSGMFLQSWYSSLNLSHFNTSNVTNMSGMFEYTYMTSLNVTGWDVSNVTNSNNIWNEAEITTFTCDQIPMELFGKTCTAP